MSIERLNIVLLTIDCWRADHFRSDGDDPSPTPNLDRLAADAAVFNQAVTCGGWTRPSITSLLSSTHASLYGGPLDYLSSERPLVQEALQANGYETGGFTTNPQVGKLFGFDRGFDTFIDFEPDGAYPGLTWSRLKGAQRLLQQPATHRILKMLGIQSLPPEITTPASQLTEHLEAWLLRPRQRPTFAWAHYMDAHWPYHILRKSHSTNEIAQIWREINMMFQVTNDHGWLYPGETFVRGIHQLYREALSYVDDSIGRLIARLKAEGQWEKTIFIITSDHGEEFYEHGRWGHYQLYDESVHVPLIIRIPGLGTGKQIENQISLLDIAPTILDQAGAPIPNRMMGISLVPYLNGKSSSSRMAYVESMWPDAYRLALRSDGYKYIFDSHTPSECQLFDLQVDPDEKFNIIEQRPREASRFEQLRLDLASQAAAHKQPVQKGRAVDPAITERFRALGYLDFNQKDMK
jgi:arylsulfatase A-like enzyme